MPLTPRQERMQAAYQTIRKAAPDGSSERLAAHAIVLDGISGCGEIAAVYMIGEALADVCHALSKVKP